MARARNIKPGFFKNEQLAECEPLARILFEGLWCEADRAGRLEDRPKRLKAEILPYDNCDIEDLLGQLVARGFIVRYCVDGQALIQVTTFTKHQNPHVREPVSSLPAPDQHSASTVQAPDKHQSGPADSGFLIPDSGFRIPEVGAAPKPAPPPANGDDSPVAITVPLTGNRSHAVTEADLARLRELHPAIDAMHSLRRMVAWLEADPSRQSATARGARKRIASWLGGDQDRAGAVKPRAGPTNPVVPKGMEGVVRLEQLKSKILEERRASRLVADGDPGGAAAPLAAAPGQLTADG